MSRTLTTTIAAYIEASNSRNADALITCFTSTAIVVDEAQTYHGIDEIGEWIAKTQAAYAFTLEVLDAAERGRETVVTCRVTGTFPGSPIDLHFFFTLEGDQIAALTIHP